MHRYEPRLRLLALLLAALAGFVDAIGFVLTQGLFVSFMSGNSTRLSVALVDGPAAAAWGAGGLIAAFVAGVVLGSLIAAAAGRRRKLAVIGLAALILAGAASVETFALARPATMLLALAMGALNNVFLQAGEVSVGVTYMTGTLVRFGQRLAARLRGRRGEWLPYFGLWIGFVAGAIGGALLATRSPALCLWLAAAACALLALSVARVEARPAL